MKLKGRAVATRESPRSSPRKASETTPPRAAAAVKKGAAPQNGNKAPRGRGRPRKAENMKVETAEEEEYEVVLADPEEVDEMEAAAEGGEMVEGEYEEEEGENLDDTGEVGEQEPAAVAGGDPSDTVYDWIDEETYVPKAEPNLMSLVRRHLFKGSIIYICKICEKGFDSMPNLAKHIGRKHPEVPIRAGDADYSDDIKPNMKRKYRRRSKDPNAPRVKRESKGSPQTGERQYPCPHCSHWAMTKEALRVHIYTHTGERHHECNVCGQKFTQRASLNRHMATHTGEKRHKCPICEKRFIQKCSLDRHMDTHQGIKRYKCEVCGEQYSQSYPLSKHIKKKHPEYWKEFNEDRRYMPRNTPLQQRLSDKQLDMPTPIQLFEESAEGEAEEAVEGEEETMVVEIDEPEVVPVISMPNLTKMEKKKRTVRKSMIQLKSAEDVMNLFEDVVVGPIEIAPIKGEDDDEEEGEEVEDEEAQMEGVEIVEASA